MNGARRVRRCHARRRRYAGGDPTYHEERYTVGLDARWRVGPFGLDPTISYQWGSYDTLAHENERDDR